MSFTAVSASKTKVGYVTAVIFTGDWRRRDFLPGSVGHRRALHRDSFRLAAQEFTRRWADTRRRGPVLGSMPELPRIRLRPRDTACSGIAFGAPQRAQGDLNAAIKRR